jgi:hypothetical protein
MHESSRRNPSGSANRLLFARMMRRRFAYRHSPAGGPVVVCADLRSRKVPPEKAGQGQQQGRLRPGLAGLSGWPSVCALLHAGDERVPTSRVTCSLLEDAILSARGRHRLRLPCRTACWRARRRRGSVLEQQARATRGAGIAQCRSFDLCVA